VDHTADEEAQRMKRRLEQEFKTAAAVAELQKAELAAVL